MQTKGSIKNDIVAIKKELRALNSKNKKGATKIRRAATKIRRNSRKEHAESRADENLALILRTLMEDSKATRTEIRRIWEKLEQFEGVAAPYDTDLSAGQPEFHPQTSSQPDLFPPAREVLIPRADAKIITFIQQSHRSMACAEDVRKAMGYKGKNAASSRLNRLAEKGLLERTRVGHTVYYRFTGGTLAEKVRPITPEIEES
jgi:hypothetical protein